MIDSCETVCLFLRTLQKIVSGHFKMPTQCKGAVQFFTSLFPLLQINEFCFLFFSGIEGESGQNDEETNDAHSRQGTLSAARGFPIIRKRKVGPIAISLNAPHVYGENKALLRIFQYRNLAHPRSVQLSYCFSSAPESRGNHQRRKRPICAEISVSFFVTRFRIARAVAITFVLT